MTNRLSKKNKNNNFRKNPDTGEMSVIKMEIGEFHKIYDMFYGLMDKVQKKYDIKNPWTAQQFIMCAIGVSSATANNDRGAIEFLISSMEQGYDNIRKQMDESKKKEE